MKKRFTCKYERFYGEIEDSFEQEVYANDIKEALLIIIAMMGEFMAKTQKEAITKAKQFLNNNIKNNWAVDDFFDNDILIETSDTSYRLHYLYEDENINTLR